MGLLDGEMTGTALGATATAALLIAALATFRFVRTRVWTWFALSASFGALSYWASHRFLLPNFYHHGWF